jgi:uncharacterized protein (DUF2141 family)
MRSCFTLRMGNQTEDLKVRKLLITGAMLAFAGAAFAESAQPVNLYSLKTDGPVAAVQTTFEAEAGKAVRVTIYDSEEQFLEKPHAKRQGRLDSRGVAIVPLNDLAPGEYSIAAYLDENGDGKLNRGKFLGFPKEPVAFSNGVKPKLGKPSFEETKVAVNENSVVVITLDD